MTDHISHPINRLLGAVLAAAALALAGCADSTLPPIQLSPDPASSTETFAERPASRAAEAATKTTRSTGPAAAIAEARSLRQSGHKPQALARLDAAAAAAAPGDLTLSRERGLLALELGQLDKAEPLLRAGLDPARPEWRIHSALGAALSAKGRQQDAQIELARALELSPEEPAVLNNLALSYALDGKSREAEGLLRRAASQRNNEDSRQRASQNLALLLGLGGRIDEAKTVSVGALPPEHVNSNVAFLREQAAGDTLVSSAGDGTATVKAASAGPLAAPVYQLGGPKR